MTTSLPPARGPRPAHKHWSAEQQGWRDGWVRWEEGSDSWGLWEGREVGWGGAWEGSSSSSFFLQDVAVSGVWQRRSCKSVGTLRQSTGRRSPAVHHPHHHHHFLLLQPHMPPLGNSSLLSPLFAASCRQPTASTFLLLHLMRQR